MNSRATSEPEAYQTERGRGGPSTPEAPRAGGSLRKRRTRRRWPPRQGRAHRRGHRRRGGRLAPGRATGVRAHRGAGARRRSSARIPARRRARDRGRPYPGGRRRRRGGRRRHRPAGRPGAAPPRARPAARHGEQGGPGRALAGVPPHTREGRVHFEAAVMAGTPSVGVLAGCLRGSRPLALHAVLNGTCNVILAAMEEGAPTPPPWPRRSGSVTPRRTRRSTWKGSTPRTS